MDWEGEAPAEPESYMPVSGRGMVCVQRAFPTARLVRWSNLPSSVLTPAGCDLQIRACSGVVAPLRLGRSLALPTRETSFLNTMGGCFHGHATSRGFLKSPFVPESNAVN